VSEHVLAQPQRANVPQETTKVVGSLQRRDMNQTEPTTLQEWLPDTVSGTFAEPRFGFDFSGVPALTGMVRQNRPLLRTQPMVQRSPKDGAGGSSPCPTCPEAEPTEISEPAEPAAETIPPTETTEPATEPPSPEAEVTPTTAEHETESAAPVETPASALIVEDSAADLAPGQMKKSEFLAQLRAEVTRSAEAAMAGTGRTTADCPYLNYWFGFYSKKDSAHIERAIHKYAPETASAATARDYIPIVAARVRRSVEVWARTGEITGVPDGLSMGLPGMGLLGGIGRLISGIGSIFFKARAGGARKPEDPRAIQTQLGEGRPLDSCLRSRMESAFGMDFSHVRTHTDSTAAALSARFNARAFTVGQHMAFGANEYKPANLIGDALIAHELAHTIQQRGGISSATPMKKSFTEQNTLEKDADMSAMGSVAFLWNSFKVGFSNISNITIPRLKSGLRLQRCKKSSPPSTSTASTVPTTPAASPARKVEFTGSHPLTAYGGDPKVNTSWSPGSIDHALAYTRGSNPVINAEFSRGGSLSDSKVTSVDMRVKEGGSIRGTKTGIPVSGKTVSVNGLKLTGLTGSSGIRRSNYNLLWEGSADGSKTWVPMVTTGSHLVYWINAAPLITPLYNFAVSKATGYCPGATGNAAAQAIRHGLRGVDGLGYNPGDPINTDPLSVYADGKGICTDFANLLTLLALSVGLTSNTVLFWGGFQYAGKNIWITKGGTYLTLTRVKTPVTGYAPPGGWDFNYHAISRIDGVLHDAALDRQGIDADAMHDGKVIRLVDTGGPVTLPDAKVGTPYSQTIPRTGHSVAVTLRDYGPKITSSIFSTDIIPIHVPTSATSPGDLGVIWSITGGTIPPGLKLNPLTGQISGTPTTAGIFSMNMFIMYGPSTSPLLTNTFTTTLEVKP
jgi:hypothetical protein